MWYQFVSAVCIRSLVFKGLENLVSGLRSAIKIIASYYRRLVYDSYALQVVKQDNNL